MQRCKVRPRCNCDHTSRLLHNFYGRCTQCDDRHRRYGSPTYHQRCGDARAPLESFRLSQILSFGGLVVAEASDADDAALFADIVRVEKKFYGDWSPETRKLLADGDALAAYKRRAFDLYRRRFAPEALLRSVDAWNERGAPGDWQDKST